MSEIDPFSLKNTLEEERKSVVIPDKEIRKMIYAFQKFHDYYQMEVIITANQRFIMKQVYKYSSNSVNKMDIKSEATIGMIEAIKRFDLSKDNKFLTYAGNWIKQKILIFINEYSLPLHIPFNIIWDYYKIEKFINEYKNKYFKVPNINEIIKNVKINKLRVEDVLNFKLNLYDKKLSLYDEEYKEKKDEEVRLNSIYYIDNKLTHILDKLSDYLNEDEVEIVSLYTGLAEKEKSFMEIGEIKNLNENEVKEIYNLAIEKLRKNNFTI